MAKVAEGIGKTYDEAVQNGLNKIGLSKEEVTVEIVKEPKKTFFSILEPRQVKVIVTEKEQVKVKESKNEKAIESIELTATEKQEVEEKILCFLKEYLKRLEIDLAITIKEEKGVLVVSMNGESSGLIIGHRGETLEALQVLLSSIVNKGKEKHLKIIVDAENYRAKRVSSLKELALRQASQVVKRGKSHTFEPMSAFERKAIHTALQDHPKVKTHSIGEEPYRKVVISLR